MYLSRLKLNSAQRGTREFLINPYRLHQAVYRAFPDNSDGGPGRILYRVDKNKRLGIISLLVQSDKKPVWSKVDFIVDCLLEPAECKVYSPVIQTGQILLFRVRANPTIKKKLDGKENGYRLGLLREEDQLKWLNRKAEESGFAVMTCRAVSEGMSDDDKRNDELDKMRHFAVRFEGMLKITDQEIFTNTIENGIGSAKGFGFGLLSLARIKE
ncbi:MAG: type I-E CRISPR-associated protein Cas6/Cse3/CasE [Dehalococcoidales bacterium]|nr:type I-E CRISPR-associated protein Cas6/Cse3/CasE [Dehalococcoidales bacterium]